MKGKDCLSTGEFKITFPSSGNVMGAFAYQHIFYHPPPLISNLFNSTKFDDFSMKMTINCTLCVHFFFIYLFCPQNFLASFLSPGPLLVPPLFGSTSRCRISLYRVSKNVLYRVSEKYSKYQINNEPNYNACNRMFDMCSSCCENFIYISLSIAM